MYTRVRNCLYEPKCVWTHRYAMFVQHASISSSLGSNSRGCCVSIGGIRALFAKKYICIYSHVFVYQRALFFRSRCNCRVTIPLHLHDRWEDSKIRRDTNRSGESTKNDTRTHTCTHKHTHTHARACSDIEKNMASLLNRISRWKKR